MVRVDSALGGMLERLLLPIVPEQGDRQAAFQVAHQTFVTTTLPRGCERLTLYDFRYGSELCVADREHLTPLIVADREPISNCWSAQTSAPSLPVKAVVVECGLCKGPAVSRLAAGLRYGADHAKRAACCAATASRPR
jgi:hypothetical protein